MKPISSTTAASWIWLSICISASFGQFLRFSLGPSVFVYAHDICIMAWILFWSTHYFFSDSFRSSIKATEISGTRALLFCAISIVLFFGQTLVSLQPTAIAYLLRLLLYLVGGLSLAHTLRTEKKEQVIERGWWLFAGSLCWFGLLQFILLPDTRFLFVFGWDDHYYRLISTLFDPNYTGLFLGIAGLLSIQNYLRYKTHTKAWLATATFFLAALFLTFSRGSWLATALGACYLISGTQLWHKQKKNSITFGIFIIVVSFTLSQLLYLSKGGEGLNLLRTSTIQARFETQKQLLTSLSPLEWVIGRGLFVGYRSYQQPEGIAATSHSKLPDSWPILLISSGGIIGTLSISMLFLMYFRKLHPTGKLILTIWLTHGLSTASLVYPFALVLLVPMVLIYKKEK